LSAASVTINPRGATAKARNPWTVLGLTIVTLGFYHLFWYYFVNREMADYGEGQKTDLGTSPAISVVAITLGAFLIIPPFVSIYRTGKRMQLSQRVAGVHGGSGALFLLLSVLPLVNLFAPVYLQSQLNKVWGVPGLAAAPVPAVA
jgi:Domain of unknown function (DUF4234)